MDWFAPIDLYCERTAPGLTGEPLNALSNLAFFVAAFAALRDANKSPRDVFVAILIAIVVLIGLGSSAFHVFANRWSLIADIAPITAFIYAYFLFALRRFVALGRVASVTATALFFAASWLFARAVPQDVLNGSIGYLPAFVGLAGVAAILFTRGHPAAPWLLAAAATFLVSLTFRTVDLMVCSCLPGGTHFVWHMLNALVLYLALRPATGWRGAPATPNFASS